MGAELAGAIERGDLDELLRLVDALSGRRNWEGLLDLRDRCQRAHRETGRQLWPAAAHAEYRLALEAPGPWAGSVLLEGAGRFALGPLPEVAASTHSWSDLAPHAPPGPAAVVAAHERVLRGENLTETEVSGPPVLELPLRLEPWEPVYAVAEYQPHEAHFPAPPITDRLEPVTLPGPGRARDDPQAIDALLGVVGAWTTGSEGRAAAVAVHGGALEAIAALGRTSARAVTLTALEALAWLGWAGASGGAHGRRRGAAAGRLGAWWALTTMAGLADEWPAEPERLGEAAERLHWMAWDASEPTTGWALRVAVADPRCGRAWAIDAVDA